MNIQTYEQLLEIAEESLFEEHIKRDLKFGESLNYSVKIFGDTWNGTIDYRLAKYILDIQKSIDKLYDELGIQVDRKNRALVKFSINEGCTEAIVEIAKTLREIFNNMESSHKLYLATLILLSIVGSFTVWQIKEYKSEQLKLNHDLETSKLLTQKEIEQQQRIVEIVETLSEKIPDYTKANKSLAANLIEGDEIKFSTQPSKFTKEEFKKQYPGKGKYKPESVYIDGRYLITAIILETGQITIDYKGHRYDCLSSLSKEESSKLFSQVQAAHTARKGFELDLKITAKYYKGKNEIRDLIIYEIGSPRTGSKPIDSFVTI